MLTVVVLAAGLGALGGWVLVDHFGGTPDDATAASREVAQRYLAGSSDPEQQALAGLYAPNAVFVDKALNEVIRGSDAIQAGNLAVASFPGYRLRGSVLFATRDRAVVTWVMSAESNPFTGAPFTTNGVSILEIENGVVTRETIYYDRP